MSRDAGVPLNVFFEKIFSALSPGASISIPPEILNGERPPTAEELAARFPPMRVVLEFPDQGERYFLRVARRPPMAGKAGLPWSAMKTRSALVVDRDKTRSDVIILTGLKDEYKEAIRAVFQTCRAKSQPPGESGAPRRPKKFVPSKNGILVGGGRVTRVANEMALYARAGAKWRGHFTPTDFDEDSAS